MPKLASKNKCTGCMLCLNVCNSKAISTEFKDGFLYPIINPEKCINCLLCEKCCPEVNYRTYETNFKSVPFMGWSKNSQIRFSSASGGAFTEIALQLMSSAKANKRNCAVAGAKINENNEIIHSIVLNEEDLKSIQGTKYLQSNVYLIYKEVLNYLEKDWIVLFSGLPCQVNALYRFLYKKRYSGELITCDLICNGVPSKTLLNLDIKYNLSDLKRILSFRDKYDGWTKCLAFSYEDTNDNIIRIPEEKSFFLKAMKTNYYLRKSCYNCNYCNIERKSDFTLGDYWGYKNANSEYGVSLLICHNQNAVNIIRNSTNLYIKKITWKDCLPNNPRIYSGKRFIGYAIPDLLKKRIEKSNFHFVNRIYTDELGIISKRNIYLIPFKIWTIILKYSEKLYRKCALKNILKKYE